jgi:hypothetical protein
MPMNVLCFNRKKTVRTNYNDKSIEEVRQENMRFIDLWLATPSASQNYKPIRPLAPSEATGKHGKVLPGSLGEKWPEHIGKPINPQFVEWMMGFPKNWTKID